MERKRLAVCLVLWLGAVAGCVGPAAQYRTSGLGADGNQIGTSPVRFGLQRPRWSSTPLSFSPELSFAQPWSSSWRVRLWVPPLQWWSFGRSVSEVGESECNQCGPRRLTAFLGHVPLLDRLWLWEAAWRCSNKALQHYQRQCGQKLSHDFKAGFRRAYWDLLRGGNGQVPPVPPKKYWSPFYRSPLGRRQAEQWLEGYRVGVEFARADGLDRFGRVVAATVIDQAMSEPDAVEPADPSESWCEPAPDWRPGAIGGDDAASDQTWRSLRGPAIESTQQPGASSGRVPPSPGPPPSGDGSTKPSAVPPSSGQSSFGGYSQPEANAAVYWDGKSANPWRAIGVGSPHGDSLWTHSKKLEAAQLGWSRPF